MRKKEYILFGIILAICLSILAVRWGVEHFSGPDLGYIRITARGKEFGVYSLAEDQTISIMDTNLCQIQDGVCTMIAATCPGQDYSSCIYQDPIYARNRGMIVCLPNNVIIEFTETSRSFAK